MSRITVEDCLQKVNSRFELVMLASRRARQLFREPSRLLTRITEKSSSLCAKLPPERCEKPPANPDSWLSTVFYSPSFSQPVRSSTALVPQQ